MNKLEVFNDLKSLIFFLKKKSESCLLCEICGLIAFEEGKFIYQMMSNKSKNPSLFFYIDPFDYLNFVEKHKCFCIFHSHINTGEDPSDFDIKTSDNCCLCFLIYSNMSKKFSLYEPHYKDYDVNITEGIRNYLNEY